MRICEANTRILRANYQPNIDAMAIRHLSPAPILQRHPKPAENRTLCRARALSKREAFVASGRGRRQAAEAGAYLRSKYADSPRKASTQYGCDVARLSACHAPRPGIPNTAENRTLCRARAAGRSRAVALYNLPNAIAQNQLRRHKRDGGRMALRVVEHVGEPLYGHTS